MAKLIAFTYRNFLDLGAGFYPNIYSISEVDLL